MQQFSTLIFVLIGALGPVAHSADAELCSLYKFTGEVKLTEDGAELMVNQGSRSQVRVVLSKELQNLLKAKRFHRIELTTPALKRNKYSYAAKFHALTTRIYPSVSLGIEDGAEMILVKTACSGAGL